MGWLGHCFCWVLPKELYWILQAFSTDSTKSAILSRCSSLHCQSIMSTHKDENYSSEYCQVYVENQVWNQNSRRWQWQCWQCYDLLIKASAAAAPCFELIVVYPEETCGPVTLTSCTLDSLVRISLAWKRNDHKRTKSARGFYMFIC